jgi:hypothetical protein
LKKMLPDKDVSCDDGIYSPVTKRKKFSFLWKWFKWTLFDKIFTDSINMNRCKYQLLPQIFILSIVLAFGKIYSTGGEGYDKLHKRYSLIVWFEFGDRPLIKGVLLRLLQLLLYIAKVNMNSQKYRPYIFIDNKLDMW